MPYRELNSLIRERILDGCDEITLEHVTGQRYIGAGLEGGVRIRIQGIPGQDLGVFMGGARIEVHGNAQDGVGNTMNDGTLIIHGSVGDIPGHMMRNGRIFIRGRAGFRAGIMMKEYQTSHPVMVIGETAGDYLGEYMAGGTIVVLGMGCAPEKSPVDMHVASGIFGGTIYVRGLLEPWQLGGGALMSRATTADMERIVAHLDDFCRAFDLAKSAVLDSPFTLIRAAGERPYGKLYVHGNKTSRGLKPVHRNLTPPCAEACPIGIPNPVIIRKIREGAVAEALGLIDEYTPFRYSCCGIVCPGLCRAACTRNSLDEPVRIDEIARRYAPSEPAGASSGVEREETIAVIGAGPAGLSAAWQLARTGIRRGGLREGAGHRGEAHAQHPRRAARARGRRARPREDQVHGHRLPRGHGSGQGPFREAEKDARSRDRGSGRPEAARAGVPRRGERGLLLRVSPVPSRGEPAVGPRGEAGSHRGSGQRGHGCCSRVLPARSGRGDRGGRAKAPRVRQGAGQGKGPGHADPLAPDDRGLGGRARSGSETSSRSRPTSSSSRSARSPSSPSRAAASSLRRTHLQQTCPWYMLAATRWRRAWSRTPSRRDAGSRR